MLFNNNVHATNPPLNLLGILPGAKNDDVCIFHEEQKKEKKIQIEAADSLFNTIRETRIIYAAEKDWGRDE